MCKLVLEYLKKAKAPIIYVGNGVRLGEAEEELNKLLEKLNIPILTTWRAMDLFPYYHHLHCGRPGMIGQRGANTTLQNCDFLLCLGTRLDLASVAFKYENFAPKAVKFLVDIDKEELSKIDIDESWVTYNQDVKSFLHNLNNKLDNPPYQKYNSGKWLKKCKELHSQPIETIKSDELSLYKFIEQLTPYLKDQVIAVGSSGTISEVFCQSFEVQPGCRIIQSNGLGSMGFGLSAAIGAHYASGKHVVMLDGDGSFAMNIQELALVAYEKLPITMIILNNNGYNSIKNTQYGICDGRLLGVDINTGLCLPNYEKLAKGFGIPYFKFNEKRQQCLSLCELESLEHSINAQHPYIIEVFIDPLHKTQCRTTTKINSQGQPEASGLENLWP